MVPALRPAISSSWSLTGIFDNFKVVLFGNSVDLVHIVAQAVELDYDDRLGAGSDSCFDLIGGHQEGFRIDIHKNRNSVVVQNTGCAAAQL